MCVASCARSQGDFLNALGMYGFDLACLPKVLADHCALAGCGARCVCVCVVCVCVRLSVYVCVCVCVRVCEREREIGTRV